MHFTLRNKLPLKVNLSLRKWNSQPVTSYRVATERHGIILSPFGMYYMKTFPSSRSRGKKMSRISSGETFVHWNLRKLLYLGNFPPRQLRRVSLCLPSSQQPGARDRRPILEKLHSLWGSWKKLKSHPRSPPLELRFSPARPLRTALSLQQRRCSPTLLLSLAPFSSKIIRINFI